MVKITPMNPLERPNKPTKIDGTVRMCLNNHNIQAHLKTINREILALVFQFAQ